MPGHPISPEEVKKSLAEFDQLFDEHDVIFVLTDSRESRWLPTLLGAAKNKVKLWKIGYLYEFSYFPSKKTNSLSSMQLLVLIVIW